MLETIDPALNETVPVRSVLLMAYQISPSKGSEYSVGWNFAIELAKRNKVYVLCGASGEHMGDTVEIESHLQLYPNPNIILLPIRPTKLARLINWFNKIGFGPLFYFAFSLWHKEAYFAAKALVARERIDVVHQLGPIGFREPGYLWKLGLPHVWGPVGGALFVKPALLAHLPWRDKVFLRFKNWINHLQLRYSKRVQTAARTAFGLTFCSSENKESFEKYFGLSGPVVAEQGAFKIVRRDWASTPASDGSVRLVWAGRMARQKNLAFLLSALSLIDRCSKWKLHLIGDGPQRNALFTMAEELGLNDRIQWHGKISREKTIELMGSCNIHVMTSLFEGNPAVVFETISLGVPTISLELGGMRDVLAGDNGVLVPVTTYDKTLHAYVKSLQQLIDEPNYRERLVKKMKGSVEDMSWQNKIARYEAIYSAAIDNHAAQKKAASAGK
ncbi:glycosyltransferase family 4 protein [Massilia varians]|uniref:glycosyltransferase family 4 protein n=1 Tax=Massilia varians TaxID=457921 RepID=UPI0025575F71|nr:glycosyltransferase family 4 protein [Massilia varians]MDK6079277.1 glycosyltransferase family 4 protein [Massilia varians]